MDWSVFEKSILVYFILLFLSLDGILRLLESLFGVPDPFRKWKLRKEKEQLDEHLRHLGILSDLPYHAQVAQIPRESASGLIFDPVQEIGQLLLRYTRDLGESRTLGRDPQGIRARYLVGTNTPIAADLDRMASILGRLILNEQSKIDKTRPALDFAKFAVPLSGSPALVIALTRLDAFKDCPYTLVGDPAVRGWDFSGASVDPEDSFILIDDVAYSGSSLVESARKLKARGARISHAFVLLERTDADRQNKLRASSVLMDEGITLHAVLQMDDEVIAEMLKGAGRWTTKQSRNRSNARRIFGKATT